MVILEDNKQGGFSEVGTFKTFGTGKNKHFSAMPKDMLQAIQDDNEVDDVRIQDYLESNKDKVMCQFYLQGHCKYGEKCMYLHPGANDYKESVPDYNEADDVEC